MFGLNFKISTNSFNIASYSPFVYLFICLHFIRLKHEKMQKPEKKQQKKKKLAKYCGLTRKNKYMKYGEEKI